HPLQLPARQHPPHVDAREAPPGSRPEDALAVDPEASLAPAGHFAGFGTCWSMRTGFPSGSVSVRYAGPVVDTSASFVSVRPRPFSVCCMSRTSSKAGSVFLLESQPGLKV